VFGNRQKAEQLNQEWLLVLECGRPLPEVTNSGRFSPMRSCSSR
jgi:hypothetical protein